MNTFQLRSWQPGDLPDLVHHANNPRVARYLTDRFPHPYTEADGLLFLTQQQTPLLRAIVVEGRAVGGVGLHPQTDLHRPNAEIGYWLSEDYWGRGIMPAAVAELVAFGFTMLDIDRIFASVFAENTASQRVLEKVGFRQEARLQGTLCKYGQNHDELIYGLRRPA